MISVELVQERLADLYEQRRRRQIDLYAIEGAIQDCQFWLSVLADKEHSGPQGEPQNGPPGGDS